MGKRTIIPFGPQHPVLPEPVHLDLVVEDETVIEAIPSIGFIHRGLEKLVEKPLFAEGFVYENQPVMLTEAGGISLGTRCNPDSWGYSDTDSEEDFLTAYRHVIQSIYSSDLLCGFCYTQLADIQQEQNGLLNEDHQFKIDPQKIREINDSRETTTSFSTIEDC